MHVFAHTSTEQIQLKQCKRRCNFSSKTKVFNVIYNSSVYQLQVHNVLLMAWKNRQKRKKLELCVCTVEKSLAKECKQNHIQLKAFIGKQCSELPDSIFIGILRTTMTTGRWNKSVPEHHSLRLKLCKAKLDSYGIIICSTLSIFHKA